MSPVGTILHSTIAPFLSPVSGSHEVWNVSAKKWTNNKSSGSVTVRSRGCPGFDFSIKKQTLSFKMEPSSHPLKRKPLLPRSYLVSTPFLSENLDASMRKQSIYNSRCPGPLPPRAYMDFPYKIPHPDVAEKPKWWWRTLACVPYLMALQMSDTGFYFHPLMERHEPFEFLSYYIPGAIRRLPSWFLMVYCFVIYVGVVRNRKWPHFFRYNVMMGLLLENVVQIVWYASNFMPLIHYSGTYGLYYWAIVGFAFVLLLSECARSALAGMYVNIPFVSDAAYMHTPYVRGEL